MIDAIGCNDPLYARYMIVTQNEEWVNRFVVNDGSLATVWVEIYKGCYLALPDRVGYNGGYGRRRDELHNLGVFANAFLLTHPVSLWQG
jgi:hypothetical protein